MSTTRRMLLQGSIAFTAGTAVTQAGAARSGAPPTPALTDPLAPESLHHLYRRIRFGANGQAIYWWLHGTRYGLVDNVLLPFFDMHVGSIHRRRDLDADRYAVDTAAAIYYTPVGGDRLLERWDNPVTARAVQFEYAAPRISTATFSLREGQLDEPEAPGMHAERKHFMGPARRDAGRIWLDEATHVRVDRGAKPPMKVHDLYTYSVAESDLARPEGRGSNFTPAIAAFNDFNDWSPRFEMGDHPGLSISRCTGTKVASIDAMPAVWRALYGARHPRGFAPLQSAGG